MSTWDDLLAKEAEATEAPGFIAGRLALEWVIPPFTILDSASGRWQERRRRWLSLGIESELGRGGMTAQRLGQWEGREAEGDGVNPGSVVDESRRQAGAKRGALDRVTSMLDYNPSWAEHPSYKRSGAVKGAVNTSPQLTSAYGRSAGRGMDAHPSMSGREAYRRQADGESNLTGAADLPEYATQFGMEHVAPGTSIFDPVLAECAYRWWCPPGGTILDPFAGGSVRGIVAAMLGHAYTGIDLSADQVAANREQAQRIVPADRPQPRWFIGDSNDVLDNLTEQFDMVFSCPPYYDLEVYSDDPRDLSTLATYAQFVQLYGSIIQKAVGHLRAGRFAGFVVSDIRGPGGAYVGLTRDTETLFEQAGAHKYNEAILVNAAGTLAMRTMKQMERGRKLGRMHQEVLVFAKGEIDTRGWDRAREAPPDPQQSLDLIHDAPAPVQEPLLDVPSLLDEPEMPADVGGQEASLADLAGADDHYADAAEPAPEPAVEVTPSAAGARPTSIRPLTLAEETWAGEVAAARQAQAEREGRHQSAAPPGSAQAGDGSRHLIGARGELAAAILLDVAWPASVGAYAEPDLAPDIEVRTSARTGRILLIRPRELEAKAARRFVGLFMDGDGLLWPLGWCYGHEALGLGDLTSFGNGGPECYAIAEADLRPMAEFERPPGIGYRVPLGRPSSPAEAFDDQMDIRVPFDHEGRCQRCGAPLEDRCQHRPFVAPEEARGLFDAGIWQTSEASAEDEAAMREAGLWPEQ